MITEDSALAFSEWLAREEPALFDALEREAATKSARLNGVTDFFKSVGASISTAVTSVAKYVSSTEGIGTLAALGGTILQSKAQQNVLKTQVALAQAGAPPAPIVNGYNANGQIVPIYQPTNMPVSNSMLANLAPSFLQQYALPIAFGGGLLLLFAVLRR